MAPSSDWVRHRVGSEETGWAVEEVLRQSLGVSGRIIQRLTRSRGVRHNRRPASLARRVKEGDTVEARLRPSESSDLSPVKMELSILYEDDDVIAVDKPPFLLVHPTAPRHTRTLAHGIAHHFASRGIASRVRPVHRIDRDTSGVVLLALTAAAHHQLDLQLRSNQVERGYLAFVDGRLALDAGSIDEPIGRDPRRPHLRRVDPRGDSARTRYLVVRRYSRASLLELELDTGRTDQIRVHLAHLGHPVIGDRQYGGPEHPDIRRQALHAARIAFHHPSSREPLEIRSALPPDLATLEIALANEEAPPGG